MVSIVNIINFIKKEISFVNDLGECQQVDSARNISGEEIIICEQREDSMCSSDAA